MNRQEHLRFLVTITLCLALLHSSQSSWIDPATPEDKKTTYSLKAEQYKWRGYPKTQKNATNSRTHHHKSTTNDNENDDDDDEKKTLPTATDPTTSPTSPPTYHPTFNPTPSPTSAPTTQSSRPIYNLVMSDEFNTPGRTFHDGHDPMWTAIDKNDYTNDALHYYSPSNTFTDENGNLIIRTTTEKTTVVGFDDVKKNRMKVDKHFKSSMMQSWNKFCFTGGIIEAEAVFPGDANVAGLWPAFWLLGNIARHTFVGTSRNIWPWSKTKPGTCAPHETNSQKLNACKSTSHYGLSPGVGRGAPEVDIYEIQAGPTKGNTGAFEKMFVGQPLLSASYQVAPGKSWNRPGGGNWPGPGEWYDGIKYGVNTTLNINFFGNYNHFKDAASASYDYWSDALSYNKQLDKSNWDVTHKYRLEWEVPDEDGEEGGKDGYLHWFVDNDLVLAINGTNVKAIAGAEIPSEPMSVIINTAVSRQWGFPMPCPEGCDCKTFDCESSDFGDKCGFPEGFCEMFVKYGGKANSKVKSMLKGSEGVDYQINYIRVYQNPLAPLQKVGCSTPERPTRRWIQGNADLYKREQDSLPLLPIVRGGGMCDVEDIMSCGRVKGSNNGVCVARGRRGVCKCKEGFTGPFCLANDGEDDVEWDRDDNFDDLNFEWPAVSLERMLWMAGLGVVVMGALVLNKPRLDGYTSIGIGVAGEAGTS